MKTWVFFSLAESSREITFSLSESLPIESFLLRDTGNAASFVEVPRGERHTRKICVTPSVLSALTGADGWSGVVAWHKVVKQTKCIKCMGSEVEGLCKLHK